MKTFAALALALALTAGSQEQSTNRTLADGVLRLSLEEQVDLVPEFKPAKPELIKLPPEASGSPSAAELLKRSLGSCPAGCDCANCPVGDCDCGCGCSLAATVLKAEFKREEVKEVPKEVKPVDLPAAFKHDFKHDCGCGSLPCNCFGPGGCHCNEHRAENRQPLRWRHDGETWGLFRGKRQVGALDSKGVYYPLDADADRWLPPTKAPLPPPAPGAVWEPRLAPVLLRSSGSC